MNFMILLLTVSVLWLGSEIVLALAKRSARTDRNLDQSSIRILWTTIITSATVGILLGLRGIAYIGGGSYAYPIVGLLLIICGSVLRWIAIAALDRYFTVDVSITKDHRIVREGIYHFVRHPAYAGSICSFIGLGVFFGSYLSVLVISLPITAAFLHRIRIEEKALMDRFAGEYADYCASTKRLIPGVY